MPTRSEYIRAAADLANGWRDQANRILSPEGHAYPHAQAYPDECVDAIAMKLMDQIDQRPKNRRVVAQLWSGGSCSIELDDRDDLGHSSGKVFSENRKDRPAMALIRCVVDSRLLE